jgi:tetratricopeptide (TPR) repeat protein
MIKLLLVLAFAICFTLAVELDYPIHQLQSGTEEEESSGVMASLLGDSRRMLANQLFVEADVYFHSGYYPSMFDKQETDIDVKGGSNEGKNGTGKAEIEESFLGPPQDWIERFGRHFFPTVHTHLDDERSREVLPWLEMAAGMDPHLIETYLSASYWLRNTLNKPDEAEKFLREGLRANPDSFEILVELGNVDLVNRNDPKNARPLFALALKKWEQQEAAGTDPAPKAHGEILDGMVAADDKLNDLKQMLIDLEALKTAAPDPKAIEKKIEETKAKLAGQEVK